MVARIQILDGIRIACRGEGFSIDLNFVADFGSLAGNSDLVPRQRDVVFGNFHSQVFRYIRYFSRNLRRIRQFDRTGSSGLNAANQRRSILPVVAVARAGLGSGVNFRPRTVLEFVNFHTPDGGGIVFPVNIGVDQQTVSAQLQIVDLQRLSRLQSEIQRCNPGRRAVRIELVRLKQRLFGIEADNELRRGGNLSFVAAIEFRRLAENRGIAFEAVHGFPRDDQSGIPINDFVLQLKHFFRLSSGVCISGRTDPEAARLRIDQPPDFRLTSDNTPQHVGAALFLVEFAPLEFQ